MNFYNIPGSLPEEINNLGKAINEYLAGKITSAELRSIRVPFGVYEQRQDNAFMARIRCAAGGITPAQLIKVAELSKRYGSGIMHVTTRQEIQIHDVNLEDIAAIMRELLAVGLSSRGGGGNTVRNITASVDSGISPSEVFDVEPYARALTSKLIAQPDSWILPRKFKISFSNGPDDSANATVQDVGFIARVLDNVKGFKVYTAGGLGHKPMIGHLLHEFIKAEDAYKTAAALKRVFDKYGNRKNKHQARLRFLWNKYGKDRFLQFYKEETASLESEGFDDLFIEDIENISIEPRIEKMEFNTEDFDIWVSRYVYEQKQNGLKRILIPLELGNISADDAVSFARFLENFGENLIRFSIDQNIHVRNFPEGYLGNLFHLTSAMFKLSKGPVVWGNITACAGASTCKLGLCYSRGAASAVYKKAGEFNKNPDELRDLKIKISGCPNSCGQHQIADLGFYGKAGRNGSRVYPAYNIVAGAVVRDGLTRFAHKIGEVSARDLPDLIFDILGSYISKSTDYNDFSEYIDDKGIEELSLLCGRYKNIPDFSADKNYYYDWGSEEVFSIVKMGKGECSAGLFDTIDLDVESIKNNRKKDAAGEEEMKNSLFNIVFASSRMLLVTKGIEVENEQDVFEQFEKAFIDTDLIENEFRHLVKAGGKRDYAALIKEKAGIYKLSEAVINLYESMDDSLRFPDEKANIPGGAGQNDRGKTENKNADIFKDYRGVKCPLNFVKTKLDLEAMESGQILEILLDDGDPIENVPRSVAEEGHNILDRRKEGDSWAVLIQKN